MSNARNLANLLGTGTQITAADIADGVIPEAKGTNLIINGAMTVDQRHNGSSFTIVNGNGITGIIADRFRVNEASGAAMTGQRVADAPVGFEYSSKLTVTTADASLGSTEFHRMVQPIEGKDISHLNWGTSNAKTLTLTFYVKSSLTGQYYISVFNNAADRTLLKGYTISSANTWEKKTITIIGDQSGTWLTTSAVGIHLMWSLGTGSSYQSNTLNAYQAGFYMAKSDQVNLAATNGSTWQLTGVQLEVGDTSTVFAHEEIGTTLLKCQRYYMQWGPLTSGGFFRHFAPAYTSNSYTSGNQSFPVEMRAVPTVAVSAITYQNATSWGTGSNDKNQINTYSQSTGTSTISGAYVNNNGTDYAYASAEL